MRDKTSALCHNEHQKGRDPNVTKKLEATVNNLPQRRQMAEGAELLLEACAGDFQLAVEALIAIQEQGAAQVEPIAATPSDVGF